MSLRALSICFLICAAPISCLADADGHLALQIVAPKPDATVHDNNGNLTVSVAISPPPRADAGDSLALRLDGKAVSSGSVPHFKLTNIDRGRHTLQAQLKSADGAILATSLPVKFEMWRASIHFPARAD